MALLDAATTVSNDANTGEEHGEAINAEVAPNKNACAETGNLILSSICVSIDGKSMLIISNKYKPIATKSTADNKPVASPIIPDEPNTFPSSDADNPKSVNVVASPAA